MCMAIYIKKYLKCDDELAFISPCIAKKTEITAVSYTHLDVYKRQITFIVFMLLFSGHGADWTYITAQLCGGGLMLGAVSYTHLDVYKRQQQYLLYTNCKRFGYHMF